VNYTWSTQHRSAVRASAVSDVLDDGMSLIGAAAKWNVQVIELQRLVDEARSASVDES
jgi:hypothetical protein